MKQIIFVLLVTLSFTCCKKQLAKDYSGSYYCECLMPGGNNYNLEFVYMQSNDDKGNLLQEDGSIWYYVYLNLDGSFYCTNPFNKSTGRFKKNGEFEIEFTESGWDCKGIKQ